MERIRDLLPHGARALRDRGAGLYVSPERIDGAYFRSEPMGGLFRVHPTAALVNLFEREEPAGALAAGLVNLRGRAVEDASVRLFAEVAKLKEAPEPARILMLDRAIRQRAALALRAGGGGGLYGCAVLLESAKR